MTSYEEIFRFWFGNDDQDNRVIAEKSALWFRKNPQTDAEIERRFLGQLETAKSVSQASVETLSARPRLANIILLDQFSRNIFRDEERSFATDDLALALCLKGLELQQDLSLRPVERVFFYLPLEHSENAQIQEKSVKLFRQLTTEVKDSWREAFMGFLDYALSHQQIIERFGRFPHRNKILGRESTNEELTFLKGPGSSF